MYTTLLYHYLPCIQLHYPSYSCIRLSSITGIYEYCYTPSLLPALHSFTFHPSYKPIKLPLYLRVLYPSLEFPQSLLPTFTTALYPSPSTVPARVVSWGGVTGVHWEEDVSLRCEAVGIPPPGRTWYRDNIIINDATNKWVRWTNGMVCERDIIPVFKVDE